MIDPREPFFPTVMATHPANGAPGGFSNDILGGLSVREGVALQCLQGLLANPALAGNQIDTYCQMALGAAERFLAHINSELPPERAPAPVTPIKPPAS